MAYTPSRTSNFALVATTPSRTSNFEFATAAATLDQYSFRFIDDDAATGTFLAAENANISLTPGSIARIRTLISASGDPASKQFQLEYRKKPSGGSFGAWGIVTSGQRWVPILVDRTSKPPVGTPLRSDGHWSVQGLVGAWAFNEGAGKKGFSLPLNTIGSVGSASSLGAEGLVSNSSDAAPFALPSPITLNNSSGWLIISRFKFTSAGKMWCGGGGIRSFLWVSSATNVYLRQEEANSAEITVPLLQTNKWYTVVVEVFGTIFNVYIDGVKYQGAAIYSDDTFILSLIGNGYDSNSYTMGGGVDYLFAENGTFTPDQVVSLSSNPWQIYEPETIWVLV